MQLRSVMSGLTVGFLAINSVSALAAGWDGDNAPSRVNLTNYVSNFDILPAAKRVSIANTPYADTYWPGNRGGIAYRWRQFEWVDPYTVDILLHTKEGGFAERASKSVNEDEKEILNQVMAMTPERRAYIARNARAIFNYNDETRYRHPSRRDLLGDRTTPGMTREQIAVLSPTEKFDILNGDYSYSLTKRVLGTKQVNAGAVYWQGICHGWAPASANHREPQAVDVVNPDGIVIPFGSGDVKAILDNLYATVSMKASYLGNFCHTDLNRFPKTTDEECTNDVNAGSFHIVLANFVGLQDRSLVADVSRGHEMWNNAIYQYDTQVIERRKGTYRGAANGTAEHVHVVTKVRYPSDDQRLPPQWNGTVGKEEKQIPDTLEPLNQADWENVYRYEEATYDYWLDLNNRGEIVGGSWVSEDRPDTLWVKNRLRFVDDYAGLAKIYCPTYERYVDTKTGATVLDCRNLKPAQ